MGARSRSLQLLLRFITTYPVESPACVTPKFICNDVIARLAKWRVLATTGVCASARTELKRQQFLDIGVTAVRENGFRIR